MEDNLAEIISVDELLKIESLTIPSYQRPYKWTNKNINDLLIDICHAIKESKIHDNYKYRLGTILLHKDGTKLNIVDGQQRIISLLLIKKCLDPTFSCPILTDIKFSHSTTQKNIMANYLSITQWFALRKEIINEFQEAFDKTLEIVKIVVERDSEAFQLFDSQNSRGKALYPHDLLKAYHLREMSEDAFEMNHAVEVWEAKDPKIIKELFSKFLFPIIKWSDRLKTSEFSSKDIDVFKGIESTSSYTYAKRAFKSTPYFQIQEPFIAGGDYFHYVDRYLKILADLDREIKENYSDSKDSIGGIIAKYKNKSTGFNYCINLFKCALLCYYDRFHYLDKSVVIKLFSWAFMLRVDMKCLGYDSINNYAVNGGNGRYSNNVAIFSLIYHARRHTDISSLTIAFKSNSDNKSWEPLRQSLLKLNGIENYG